MKNLVFLVGSALGALGLGTLHAESAYTQLDYVEATGAQWVDTGVVGRYDTKVEIKAEWTSLTGDMAILACRDAANTESRINFMNGSNPVGEGMLVVGFGYGFFSPAGWVEQDWADPTKMVPRLRYWELHRVYTVVTEYARTSETNSLCSMSVDGVAASNQTCTNVVSTGYNLTLFGNNVAGTITGQAKARCYGLKIWQKPTEDGDYVLVRDFVPVLKEGRAGLRDAVSGDFFFSATGIELVAGPDVNTPDGLVDFVESTGSQYVDLGVVGKSGVTMESRMSWTEVPGDGSYVASRLGGNARFYLYHHYQNDTIGYNGYFQSGVVAQPGVVQNVRCVLKAGEQSLTVDGVSRFARTDGATVNTGLNLYLFACNKDGTAQYFTKARCYSLKIWEGDTLVRDFRPCLKRGTGALYDQVSGTIFYPGTGKLSAGRLPTPGRPDYFVDSIASMGDNFFDTGVRARSGTRAAGDFQLTNPQRNIEMERQGYFGEPLGHLERTVLGACASDGGRRFYLCHMPNSQYWVGYGDLRFYPSTVTTNGEGVVSAHTYVLGTTRHTFDVALEDGRQAVTIDGREFCVSNVTGAVDAGCNLYLFGCNKGSTPNYLVNARVYALKIWQTPAEGGEYTLVRDFRPCVKNAQAGLYDAVNDEVVYPAYFVPTDCIGEPIITDDMKPAEVLEYVETDGSQWVDTGVTGRVDTVAEFRMAWLYRVADPDDGFLGSRKDGGDTRFYMWHDAHNLQSFGYGQFRYINQENPQAPNWRDDGNHVAIEQGAVYHVKASYRADRQTIEVNGATTLDIAWNDCLDTGRSMYLFGYNYAGSVVCRSAARLYELKIWQDDKLVRHFLPVRLNIGVNALYETVERKYYSPQGGIFTNWGPSIGRFLLDAGTVLHLR